MRLPISSLIMICMAGILFFLFISFNYAFNSDGGIKNTLWDAANDSLTGDRLSTFNSQMPKLTEGFGIASILCIALAVVFFVVDVLHDPPERRL